MKKPRLRAKAIAATSTAAQGSLAPVASSSFWGYLREPFAGAWQKNIQPEQPQNILAFSAVYACVTLICDDISKLRSMLMEKLGKIWVEVERNSPFLAVLKKPNRYQTWLQFIQQWLASKLLHGNAYILKDREALRGVVKAMYVLNPFYVQPLISPDGSVFYRINKDWLAGVPDHVTVPASEIIHDRCTALWHPLVGVSPIYACGATATQGIRIQANSESFFKNQSQPGGMLTTDVEEISDETALRLKQEFEQNFSKGNMGRLLVAGSGLKYIPIAMSSRDAELVKQLDWTVADVARAFKVPMYKLGGPLPPGATAGQLNQEYYSQTLQTHIEAIEALLTEGLEVTKAATDNLYSVELDTDGLLRLDPLTRSETAKNFVSCAVWAPNDGRLKENLPPATGGETPYLQQQNYSLEALARRDAAAPAPSSDPLQTLSLAAFGELLARGTLPNPHSPPEPSNEMVTRVGALEQSLAQMSIGISSAFDALGKLVTERPAPTTPKATPASEEEDVIDAEEFHREFEVCLLGEATP